jgi:hypothetical protein
MKKYGPPFPHSSNQYEPEFGRMNKFRSHTGNIGCLTLHDQFGTLLYNQLTDKQTDPGYSGHEQETMTKEGDLCHEVEEYHQGRECDPNIVRSKASW